MPICVRVTSTGAVSTNNTGTYPDCALDELVLFQPEDVLVLQPLSLSDAGVLAAAMFLAFAAAFGFRVLFNMRITSD